MLNQQQSAAVRYIDGPLLVLAGAGSGKTRVITQKIAYLIEQGGYSARQIVAVTFTNKAASEMRTRVVGSLPQSLRRGLSISTFHALGLTIIRKNPVWCGVKAGFSILDAQDCAGLLKNLLPNSLAGDKEILKGIQQQISRFKNDLLTPESVQGMPPASLFAERAMAIYADYQESLSAYNALDFDDLIFKPVILLQTNPEALAHWQQRVKYLLVDEYQDSNACQYELVKQLSGASARFTVVGDDDQSIYAWRGARPENLAQLQADYPLLHVMKLEQNYRSTGHILKTANHLISNNPHLFQKKLWSELGMGEPIRILCTRDEQDEADQVIADLISHKLRHGRQFGEYAILYRGNHQSRVFEKSLKAHSLRYQLSGGQSFFSRTEVRDVFAYLRLLTNPLDDAAFLRVINTPKRGIGEKSLKALGQYAQMRGLSLFECADNLGLKESLQDKAHVKLSEFKTWVLHHKERLTDANKSEWLRQLVDESGYEAYLYETQDSPLKAERAMKNVWDLIDWVCRMLEKDPDATLTDVMNKLILIDILEQSDEPDAEAIQLSTLHASKGLEYPFVYLVGMEEGLLPHRVSIEEEHIEEERRLAYVGFTRAQKALCLTLAKKRRRAGELEITEPSRFLDELPKESIQWIGKDNPLNEVEAKALANSHLTGLKALLGG